jgi:hypothetical protein
MSILELKTGRKYVSHSAMNTWLNCGWQYYLSRIVNVEEQPSYWLVGGKAVHEATEIYDLESETTMFDSTAVFNMRWNANFADSDNGKEFRAGGRASKAYPNKEDAQWWLDNGPKMVDFWVQFREDSGWKLYELPTGKVSVETELNFEIQGVEVKGFLDRLMVSPEGELVVVDIKTSSKPPATNTQLGIYAILVEKILGVRPTKGAYFLARTGELTPPVSLDMYTENRFGSWLNKFKLAVENDIFIPAPGFMCGTCSVNTACYAVNGKDSHLYPEITIGEPTNE